MRCYPAPLAQGLSDYGVISGLPAAAILFTLSVPSQVKTAKAAKANPGGAIYEVSTVMSLYGRSILVPVLMTLIIRSI